jgi:2-oxoglutarate dehydrogenase complex dehydrogenase (E1) component-like enzyme
MADLNPLEPAPGGHPDLDYDEFGFSQADLDTLVDPAPSSVAAGCRSGT